VYSELRARFDSRTVAGRHVVEDHMLHWVRRHSNAGLTTRYFAFELYVDAQGILRKPKTHGRTYQNVRRETIAWAAGRVCALTYRGWWWFRREFVGGSCYDLKCHAHHYRDASSVRFHEVRHVSVRAMTPGEVRYLERLTDDMRRPLVMASPWPAR
jgi:hypothetical protein